MVEKIMEQFFSTAKAQETHPDDSPFLLFSLPGLSAIYSTLSLASVVCAVSSVGSSVLPTIMSPGRPPSSNSTHRLAGN